jgi:hypothetical protein
MIPILRTLLSPLRTCFRSRVELELELLALRQQIHIRERSRRTRVDAWFRRLQLVSGNALQLGPRHQRRAKNDGHYRGRIVRGRIYRKLLHTYLGNFIGACGHRPWNIERRLADRSHHGNAHHQAPARRRIRGGNCRCNNTVYRQLSRCPGQYDPYDHRCNCRSWCRAAAIGRAMANRAENCLGVDFDDTRCRHDRCNCVFFAQRVRGKVVTLK